MSFKQILDNLVNTSISYTETSSSMPIIMVDSFAIQKLFFHSDASLTIWSCSCCESDSIFFAEQSVVESDDLVCVLCLGGSYVRWEGIVDRKCFA